MSMVPLVLILKRPHAVLFICSQTKSFRLKIVKLCVEQPETHRDTEKKNRRTLRQTGAKLFICKDRSLSRAGTVYRHSILVLYIIMLFCIYFWNPFPQTSKGIAQLLLTSTTYRSFIAWDTWGAPS
jgi:hypothetical protein